MAIILVESFFGGEGGVGEGGGGEPSLFFLCQPYMADIRLIVSNSGGLISDRGVVLHFKLQL